MRLDTPINGEDIFLRTLKATDVTPSYLGWLSDPLINSYLEARFSPPLTVRSLKEFIECSNECANTLMMGIFIKESNRHVGNIKLGSIDWNHRVGDVGFLLGDREQWGKGYATQAIILLSDYAFRQLGLAKLTAGCYAENGASRRALLNANFVEEGRRISQWVWQGCRQDGILMGLVNPSITSLLPRLAK